MLIYPAIDIYGGKAVRLFKGRYDEMTVYSDDPLAVAADFATQGAQCIHLVDLEGARDGTTANFDLICAIKARTGLFCEVGGGIRAEQTVQKYLDAGLDRVILGTAAVSDPDFLQSTAKAHPGQIAAGIDIRDGHVAIKGWTEDSGMDAFSFCLRMQAIGIDTLICTDISRDGAMKGTNRELYQQLSSELDIQIIASGGVSSLDDVKALTALKLHGAIIGKAYYTGAVALRQAIEVAK